MYNAIIAKIEKIYPHNNANKIQLANILGYQVVVGLDAKEDDIVVLFPEDGQLSESFAEANDLIAYTNELGEKKGGYFDKNRRIRCQKFRGEKSEAYCISLDSLKFTGYDINKLKVGDKFDTLNGIKICNKYITENTVKAQSIKIADKDSKFHKYFKQHVKNLFPEHIETNQWKHYSDSIESGSLITITHKLHGTSQRLSYIAVPIKLNFFQKLINKLFFSNREHQTYKHIQGTRRVIKYNYGDGEGNGGFYGTDAFRDKISNKIKTSMNKNEIIYFEIVGYTDTGGSIMGSVDTTKLKDKEFTKRFGQTMTYKYGCLQGECEGYVYRIAIVNPDGIIEDLSWDKVKRRCREMGIKHVPEIDSFIFNGDTTSLKVYIDRLTDAEDIADSIDASHIREGICIRVDKPNGKMEIYKNKTFHFKVLEGIVKDSGIIDVEEVEDINHTKEDI